MFTQEYNNNSCHIIDGIFNLLLLICNEENAVVSHRNVLIKKRFYIILFSTSNSTYWCEASIR